MYDEGNCNQQFHVGCNKYGKLLVYAEKFNVYRIFTYEDVLRKNKIK
jgi:hypothetical protein